jgi:hypothetical protein
LPQIAQRARKRYFCMWTHTTFATSRSTEWKKFINAFSIRGPVLKCC